jgi:hypothetical protein
MASLRIGAGIPARAAEVLVAAEIGLSGTVPDPAAMAGALLPVGGEAARAELAGTLAMVLRDRLAVWQRLGVVG